MSVVGQERAVITALRRLCILFRRIFLHYIEQKIVFPPTSETKAKSPQEKVAQWMWKQYKLFRQTLCTFLAGNDDWSWELSIKTLLELTKKESEYFPQRSRLLSQMFAEVFAAMLVTRKEELDADLLLVFRSEVFNYTDCVYHSLRVLFDFVTELKSTVKREGRDNGSESMSIAVQNAVDLLRMIDVPDEIDPDNFYIPLGLGADVDDEESRGSDDDNSDDDDSSVEDRKAITADARKNKRKASSLLGKRKSEEAADKKQNKRKRSQNIVSLSAYQKLFSKVWIHSLSLPMSMSMHKTLLKHISDHVLVRLHNPLMLADYLTQCYNLGGVVAVLALESLFTLILRHNLDYPHFFESLYRLCTLRILNAKHGIKYMKLLHMSLRSTNIPASLVAAFIKRLAGLALQVSAPRVAFCLAQITWLLRQHRTCQVLVHRKPKRVTSSEEDAAAEGGLAEQATTGADKQFVLEQDEDLEHSGALQSSLWELEALENHFLYDVAQLATALRDPMSTSVGNVPIDVEQYIQQASTYQELIDSDLNRRPKKNAAMAYRLPTALLVGGTDSATSLVGQSGSGVAPPTTFAGRLLAQQEEAARAAQGQRVLGRVFDW